MRWQGYQPEYLESYIGFAEQNFGHSAHQSRVSYLEWLYSKNPNKHNLNTGLILGVADDDVVACLHTMMLSWRVGTSIKRMPTVHDIMVNKTYRTGVGAVILLRALRMGKHAYIAAATGLMADVYRSLGCQRIKASWYRKILAPLSGGLRLVAGRVGWRPETAVYFDHGPPSLDGWELSILPGDGLIDAVAARLQTVDGLGVGPDWNTGQTRWRFFDPSGPKHMLLYQSIGSVVGDMAIVSLGPRKGLNLARIVEARAESTEGLRGLLDACGLASKAYGAHLMSMYSASERLNSMCRECGWDEQTVAPASYFYHKGKNEFVDYRLMGGAADFGFEALR